MTEILRTFVAVPLPEALLARLAAVQDELRRLAQGREAQLFIPRPAGIHLTLQFLGDTPAELAPAIDEKFRAALAGREAFATQSRGAGGFPNLERPRVLWAGVHITDELTDLHWRVLAGLHGLPLKLDKKPFKPHLTLARVKRSRPGTLARVMAPHLKEEFGALPVTEVVLFRSDLQPSGAIYTPLCRWELEQAGSMS
ncbi:MAG: RNA 2',3'-cyclic phosphodiesterase [Myxococcales bacterium]|nr:MAG: RNA 2',3'-cyclic phosphodiesterase [Myxococcales bacterium]